MEGRFHDTYIVQVPKDQIYRIPPPENALIVEQHRNPSNSKKSNTRSHRSTISCIICLVVFVVIVATLTALYFNFKPKNPQISIKKVEVKTHKNGTPQYLISLVAKNPNGKSGLVYANNVDVDLYHDNIMVATGKLPRLSQGPGDSSTLKIELEGSKRRPLAPQMKRSMNNASKNNGTTISLEMEMKLKMEGKIGAIEIYSMNPRMNCKMRLSSLAKDARVLSQECKAIERHEEEDDDVY